MQHTETETKSVDEVLVKDNVGASTATEVAATREPEGIANYYKKRATKVRLANDMHMYILKGKEARG